MRHPVTSKLKAAAPFCESSFDMTLLRVSIRSKINLQLAVGTGDQQRRCDGSEREHFISINMLEVDGINDGNIYFNQVSK